MGGVWLCQGYVFLLIGRLFSPSKVNFLFAILSTVIYAFSSILPADIYLVYVTLLVMVFLMIRNHITFLLAIAFLYCYTVTFLFKFISYYIITSAIITLIISGGILKSINRKIILFFLVSLVAPYFLYLIYNPSFEDLITYIKAAIQISIGMNSALSLVNVEGPEKTIKYVPLIALAFFYVIYNLYKVSKKKATIALVISSTLFFFYKEGFVRHGGAFAFASLSIVFHIMLLSINWDRVFRILGKLKLKLFVLFVIACCFIYPHNTNNIVFTKLHKIISFPNTVKITLDDKGDGAAKLSDKAASFISKCNSYSVYPWELSYGANYKNFKPMPVIQAYTAYTSWLDDKNSSFFSSTAAPECLIFSSRTIDGRFAFLESPATFYSIISNYEPVLKDNNSLFQYILKKRINPNYRSNTSILKSEEIKTDFLERPYEANLFSISITPTVIGKIVNIFYKTPEILLYVKYDDDSEFLGRIIPELLKTPVPIDLLCDNEASLDVIFNNNKGRKVKFIKLGGKGLRYMNKSVITWYKGSWKVWNSPFD